MNNEMEMLLADTHEVKINGRSIVIKKFPMLAGIRLTSKISNVVSKVVSGDEKTENFNTAINALFVNGSTDADTRAFKIFGLRVLFDLFGDDISDIVSFVISKSTTLSDEEIEEINLEDGLDLLYEIFNVNKGFFTKFSTKLKALSQEAQKEVKKKKA